MTSSSDSIGYKGTNNYPLLTPKKEEQKDWWKIGGIIAAIVGGILAAIAMACIMQMLPTDILGTPLAKGITLVVGLSILVPAAYVLYDRWQNPESRPSCPRGCF